MEVFSAHPRRDMRQSGTCPTQRDEAIPLDCWHSAGHQVASTGRPVYRVLAEHQSSEPWGHQELVQELQRWAEIFDFEYKLEIPEIALRVDSLQYQRLGHFRAGHNGFGLKGEIAINQRDLHQREFWQVLGTLLHELLHAWQQAHGKPGKRNYHNKQFRDKARELGLIAQSNGVTQYARESRFRDLLDKYGVHVPDMPEPELRPQGESKLKLWFCGCTKVRVAVAHFRAQCLICGNLFVRVDTSRRGRGPSVGVHASACVSQAEA